MQPSKLTQKQRSGRIARHSSAVAWKKDGPYLELDGKAAKLQDIPIPTPVSAVTMDDEGCYERKGVAIVIPSPWVGQRTVAAAKFWGSMGFKLRDATNCEGLICTDLREWVRMVDVSLQGRRFSPSAFLTWTREKYKEFYL